MHIQSLDGVWQRVWQRRGVWQRTAAAAAATVGRRAPTPGAGVCWRCCVRTVKCHLDLYVHVLGRRELLGHKREELVPLNIAVAPFVDVGDGLLNLRATRSTQRRTRPLCAAPMRASLVHTATLSRTECRAAGSPSRLRACVEGGHAVAVALRTSSSVVHSPIIRRALPISFRSL
jgi:hypothetical protein